MARHRYPRAKRSELAEAFAYARSHPKYKRFAPPDDELKLDLVALYMMDQEIAKRRDEEFESGRKSDLAFLVGTTIRDLFGHKRSRRKLSPEAEARAREIESLIKAYEGLMMKIFAERAKRSSSKGEETTSHPLEAVGHFRLT